MYVRLFVDAIQIYSSSKIRNTNFCEFKLLKDLFRFKTIRASIEKNTTNMGTFILPYINKYIELYKNRIILIIIW